MNIDPAELEKVLPPRDIFPTAMPRYPNLWFFVESEVALRSQYKYAVRVVVQTLEEQLHMVDDFQEGIQNHALRHLFGVPGEGSDFQMRTGPYHAQIFPENRDLSHRHQVHARFYVLPLIDGGVAAIDLPTDGHYFLIPASVHYEVCTEDPTHPYVDSCPLCGISGEYDVEIRPDSEDYCLKIHDPLGIEFMLHGTIRGQTYPEDSPRPCVSLADLARTRAPLRWETRQFSPKHLEPLAIGCCFVNLPR